MISSADASLLRTRQMSGPEQGRTYGGETAEERHVRRRAALLQAGIELFGTHGYAGTRVERLCNLAQVSTRNFYELYPSKEAAFLDVFEHLIETSYQGVVDALVLTAERPMPERITQAFSAYLHPLFDDMRTARIAFVEIVGLSPSVESRRTEMREELIALIEEQSRSAVERGEIAPRDYRFAVLALTGACTVTVHDWVTRRDERTADQMRDQLIALATFLLAG